MTSTKEAFGTSNQAITITLASLTNTGARQSTVIDNSANLYLDALVFLKVKSGASGTTAAGALYVYAFGTADGGTTYSDGAGASDAGITLTSPPNMRLIGIINVVATATTYNGGPFSVASAFGGTLPDHWGIVVSNSSGGTLDTTGGNFSVFYQGVYSTSS